MSARRAWPIVCAASLAASASRGQPAPVASSVAAAGAPAASAPSSLDVVARGATVDFVDDGRRVGRPDEAYVGRAFVPAETIGDPLTPRPLVVFLHGINRAKAPLRFAGAPGDPDVRAMIGAMSERGALPPIVLAAPTTRVACSKPYTMWPGFDLDRFVENAARALRGTVTLDLTRVVLVAHSGGGCNRHGGMFEALATTSLGLRAVLAIDTCMLEGDAPVLASAPATSDVVVTWQPHTWPRPFAQYASLFRAGDTSRGRSRRVLAELDLPNDGHAHNATVAATLEAYLPLVLTPP